MFAITGSTGELGGRVARQLAALGMEQRLIVRDAARAPDLPGAEIAIAPGYHDRAAMTAALRGVDTLFLVSGRESANRVEEHLSAVDAATDAGVQRVVYTSFVAAGADTTFTLGRHHFLTEEHIRASGMAFTFLRNSIYLDFVPFFATEDGVIARPAGEGRSAWVARDDVADVAVAVLTGDGHEGETYAVTGGEAQTLGWAAEVLTEVTGREVRYVDETVEEAYASRAHFGAPAFEVEGWVTSYEAVANGDLDVVTDVVPRLAGHPAQELRAFLEANPESWAHLKA